MLMTKWWNKEIWPAHPASRIGVVGWRPERVPLAFWIWIRRARVAGGTIYFAVLAGYIFGLVLGIRWLRLTGLLAGLALAVVWTIAPRVLFRRWKRHLEVEHWHCCLACGYSLRGLPSTHACPECGSAYEFSKLETAWQAWAKTGLLPESTQQQRAP